MTCITENALISLNDAADGLAEAYVAFLDFGDELPDDLPNSYDNEVASIQAQMNAVLQRIKDLRDRSEA